MEKQICAIYFQPDLPIDLSVSPVFARSPLLHFVGMDPSSDPFTLNEDGSAVNPEAFRAAILADAEKLAAIQTDPEVSKVSWQKEGTYKVSFLLSRSISSIGF